MNLRAYRDAVLGRLRTAPFSATDVFDGPPKSDYATRPRRYLIVYTARNAVPSDLLTGPQADHDVRVTVRAVGKTVTEAMAAAEHVDARLLNAQLTLTGRRSRRLRHVSSSDLIYDPDVGDGLFFYDNEYAWYSTPA